MKSCVVSSLPMMMMMVKTNRMNKSRSGILSILSTPSDTPWASYDDDSLFFAPSIFMFFKHHECFMYTHSYSLGYQRWLRLRWVFFPRLSVFIHLLIPYFLKYHSLRMYTMFNLNYRESQFSFLLNHRHEGWQAMGVYFSWYIQQPFYTIQSFFSTHSFATFNGLSVFYRL